MIRYDFGNPRIYCGFTTREGGVSPFSKNAMNMSFSREPNRDNVLENYRRAALELEVPFEGMAGVKQVHGRDVLQVTRENTGLGIDRPYDAMITNEPGITLCTVHGDCTPVFLFDPEHMAVAAIHSGWRGTVLKISQATVEAMTQQYGTRPETLYAIIGPAISLDAFEVDEDVYLEFRGAFGTLTDQVALCRKPMEGAPVKWHLSVPGFVYETLLTCGISAEHIRWDTACTAGDSVRFFSHRRDQGKTGAMCGMIGIRP